MTAYSHAAAVQKIKSAKEGKGSKPNASKPRLYAKGTFLGFRRGRHTQHMGTSLIKIEGVNDKKDTGFYLGKRVCYVYRASRQQQDRQGVKTSVRSIWGRVSKSHGNGGTVRAVFDTNDWFQPLQHCATTDLLHSLPANAMGSRVRVMLFPSNI